MSTDARKAAYHKSYLKHIEAKRAYGRQYYQDHKEARKAYGSQYRVDHAEELKLYQKEHPQDRAAWNKAHPEVGRKAVRKWEKANPERRAWYRKVSKGYLKQACPKWADKKELKRIYNECPEGMVVDHVIPLRGDTVCGLHVPENLQYLSREENLKKTNTFEFDENSDAAKAARPFDK